MNDNNEPWKQYSRRLLVRFLNEFQSNLKPNENVSNIANSMSNLPYEKAMDLLNSRCRNEETVKALRGRFRSYAYKKRKRLVSISISVDVKEKLDDIGSKAGTSSASPWRQPSLQSQLFRVARFDQQSRAAATAAVVVTWRPRCGEL